MIVPNIHKTVYWLLRWRRAVRDVTADDPADFWRGFWLALFVGAVLLFVIGLALGGAWYGLTAGAAVFGVASYCGLMYCGGVSPTLAGRDTFWGDK